MAKQFFHRDNNLVISQIQTWTAKEKSPGRGEFLINRQYQHKCKAGFNIHGNKNQYLKIGFIRIFPPENAADIYKKNYKKMRLKAFMACIILILSAAVSQANPGQKVAPGYDKVIKDFIESHMKSNHAKLENALNDGASIKIPRGETVLVQNKTDIVAQMKQSEGVQQNCESAYEVLAKSDAIVIARVDFTYANCIQHNYLILEKNQDKEWKITADCKIFDDIEPAETGNSVATRS